ncbi:hypothetical protein F5Y00DRAFT_264312 [Daldinia vernicosa]|uniref:uncharacterized protein n=1 Tax=Daldinia vernicosa TaxID=114800 RepID=UPI002007FFBA|nr:uncharacterized protein F5Y00DRAFT_264312 [Daldinia vernicosa]KAI0846697.1 hypothetical protein F5Y00DRAFT_264312 [Daldinia vernicosa]
MTIAAYPEVAHRLPEADCLAAYNFSEWEVRDFKFGARVQAGNPYRDDLIPPEAHPKTGFKFDRRLNELFIEQQWDCEDDDGNETRLIAVGSTVLPLECHEIPTSDDNPNP